MSSDFESYRPTPTPEMVVACPHCRASLTVPPSQAGSATMCPKCGGKFQLPLPTAYAAGVSGGGGFAPKSEVQQFAEKKVAAGICGILLGGLGIHKFILGPNSPGIIMLAVTCTSFMTGMCLIVPILGCVVMSAIGMAEGIIYLTKSDEDFYQTYAVNKKEWF